MIGILKNIWVKPYPAFKVKGSSISSLNIQCWE